MLNHSHKDVVYTNTDKHRLNALSEQIIGAAFEVSNVLGTGFWKKSMKML